MVKLCLHIKCHTFEIKDNHFTSLHNLFLPAPRLVGSHCGHLSYFTQHQPSGTLIYTVDQIQREMSQLASENVMEV